MAPDYNPKSSSPAITPRVLSVWSTHALVAIVSIRSSSHICWRLSLLLSSWSSHGEKIRAWNMANSEYWNWLLFNDSISPLMLNRVFFCQICWVTRFRFGSYQPWNRDCRLQYTDQIISGNGAEKDWFFLLARKRVVWAPSLNDCYAIQELKNLVCTKRSDCMHCWRRKPHF